MAVPTRPGSGAAIESAWGQVAHDTAVAMDLQAGLASIPASNTLTLTFPRPFASPPNVVATVAHGTRTYTVMLGAVTATTAILISSSMSSGVPGVAIPVQWMAYGPRA